MRRRRAILTLIFGTVVLSLLAGAMPKMIEESLPKTQSSSSTQPILSSQEALKTLETLEVKGRAPKTGYERTQFGNGWAKVNGCSTRDIILYRDLEGARLEDECTVVSGTLNDPYTGEVIEFSKSDSSRVQIDHVVALSDAWQKGAQLLTAEERKRLANDPLELIAVSGAANQEKSDADAATWLPKNKDFRCAYIERQVAVKVKYRLWVTEAEKAVMKQILQSC